MVIDGRAIAEKIKRELAAEVTARAAAPVLYTILVGENPVSERFLAIKKKFAEEIGVSVRDKRFSAGVKEEEVLATLQKIAKEKNTGVIVQLPLPPSFNTELILNMVPPLQDIDVLSQRAVEEFEVGTLRILPTVVAAFEAIVQEAGIALVGKRAVVIGRGKLVGAPSAVWLSRAGAVVSIADENTPDLASLTKDADIIICGAGAPGILKPEMIKEGVVILDAGTSEQGGKMVGDADPTCAQKASFFTPTPGGIGPITVAMVFNNLLKLTEEKG